VSADSFDGAALFLGENATNAMGTSSTMNVYRITAVCSGTGFGPREVQVMVKFGFPLGG
jgi:hypothetical protein